MFGLPLCQMRALSGTSEAPFGGSRIRLMRGGTHSVAAARPGSANRNTAAIAASFNEGLPSERSPAPTNKSTKPPFDALSPNGIH